MPRSDIYETVLLGLGFEKDVNMMDFAYKTDVDNLFVKGRLDLIIGSQITLPYHLKKNGLQNSDVVRVIDLPIPNLQGNFLAFNKQTSAELVELFQANLERLLNDRVKNKIIADYVEIID